MGTTLTGTFVSDTYDALIKVTDNNVITSTLKRLTDGFGNDAPMLISNTSVQFDSNLLTESVSFNTSTLQTADAVGKLVWDDADGTLAVLLKGGNVELQIGQENIIRVVNKTGSSLNSSAYQAVRVSTAQGQRLGVQLAQANNDANSADTIGLVVETIANNQEGFITTNGTITQINTTGSLQGETWADGDVLYLSGTTAGQLTNVKPAAPIHTVIMGYVVYSHATQGKIFVKVDNGYELDELHNVLITTPANNQILTYESATSLWKNKSLSTLGALTGSGTTNYLPKFTSSSAIGDSLLYDSGTAIGIGTITPTARLEVFATATRTTAISGSVDQTNGIGVLGVDTSFDDATGTGVWAQTELGTALVAIVDGGSGIIAKFINNVDSEILRVNNTNVLVNTTTDNGSGAKLQVNGLITYQNTYNTRVASYGLVLADQGKTILMNVGSANDLTVPLNSTQAFPVGTQIDIIQYGSGQTSIVATGGVTIRSSGGALKLYGQYSAATLQKLATNEWILVGDITT